jgi:sugar/nucleoside kinase (ribokinase family)
MSVDVLVIGELNVDLVLSGADVTPAFGQREKLVDDATLTLGSSAAIFATQAARLGLRTALIGVVGADLFGAHVLKTLEERGVDTGACLIVSGLKTGASVILAPRGGSRAILTYSGSIGALQPDQIDTSLFQRARHVHVASYFLLDGVRAHLPDLLARARRAGLTVSLDTNWDPAERWETDQVLPVCDLLLPNETELLAIARATDIGSALASLGRDIPLIAVKQGARGATAWRRGEIARCAARPVAVVDTTGAGDCFDAGFVFGFLAGWPLAETLRLACVCGALSTRAAGGIAGQPTLDEALA